MSAVFILSSPSKQDEAIKIEAYLGRTNKKGLPAYITQESKGVRLPPRKVFLFPQVSKEGGEVFFNISAELRMLDSNGDFILTSKRDIHGSLLDKNNIVVNNEEEAAKSFKYIEVEKTTQNPSGKFYANIGFINFHNFKKDLTPTSQTLGHINLISDERALEISHLNLKKDFAISEGNASLAQDCKIEISNLYKDGPNSDNGGTSITLFINSGVDHLKSMGVNVRVPKKGLGESRKPSVPQSLYIDKQTSTEIPLGESTNDQTHDYNPADINNLSP